jgi:hypothetical protein
MEVVYYMVVSQHLSTWTISNQAVTSGYQINQTTAEILSTDHELIHAKNASLAAMQGSASGNNIH